VDFAKQQENLNAHERRYNDLRNEDQKANLLKKH